MLRSLKIGLLYLVRWVLRVVRGHGWRFIEPLRPLLVPANAVTCRVASYRMVLDLSEPYCWNLFKFDTRMIEEFEPFRSCISLGDIVVDVGANIGLFTLAACDRTGPSGKVFSFEPLPRNHSILITNLKINKFSNAIAEQIALSNRDGSQDLFSFGTDNVSLSRSAKESADSIPSKTRVRRMDSFLFDRGIDRIDVAKIDVEGAEHLVLQGMSGLLSEQLPTLIMEVHPDLLDGLGGSTEAVLEDLASTGYTLLHLTRSGAVKVSQPSSFRFPYSPNRRPYNRFRLLAVAEERLPHVMTDLKAAN